MIFSALIFTPLKSFHHIKTNYMDMLKQVLIVVAALVAYDLFIKKLVIR